MNVEQLRDLAGCTQLCAVDASPKSTVESITRVTHNGVSFSSVTDVDDYLVAVAGESVLETLAVWFRAHHAGDTSDPFTYEIEPGRFVLVPEAEG